jgi:hypothetical protein
MRYRTLLAVAALVPLAGAALANEGYDKSTKAGAGFDTLDTNRDGRISRAEAASDSTIEWSTADANGDGYLDKAEFKKAMKSKPGDATSPSPTQPQPQSEPMPNDASGQPNEPVPPGEPSSSTTPPTDTETPRQ